MIVITRWRTGAALLLMRGSPNWQLENGPILGKEYSLYLRYVLCTLLSHPLLKCVQQLEFEFKLGGETYFKSTPSRST